MRPPRLGTESRTTSAQEDGWLVGFLTVLCLPIETFIRHSFGERHYSLKRILCAYLVLNIVLVGRHYVEDGALFLLLNAEALILGAISSIFTLSFVALAAYHRHQIEKHYSEGKEWHSWSTGISRIADLGDRTGLSHTNFARLTEDYFLYLWGEPIVCAVVAYLIMRFDVALGQFLLLCTVVLTIKNHLKFHEERARILDEIDNRIESKWRSEALRGVAKAHTAGYTVTPSLAKMLKTLDDAPSIEETVRAALHGSDNPPPAVNGGNPPEYFSVPGDQTK